MAAALGVYLLLIAVAVFWEPLSGGRLFAFRDLADYAIPQKVYAAQELASGHLPLWNPYNFCGFPLLANLQSGVLYPPNFVLIPLPLWLGLDVWLVGHVLLAAVTMFWAARRLGASPQAAALGGALYGFSGVLLSMVDLNAILATSAWLPAGVAAGVGLAERPGGRSVAVAGLVYALGFLAGEPQTLVMGGLVSFAASLLLRPAGAVRSVARWLLAAVLALLLVAPVLLSFLELARQTARTGGLEFEQVFKHSLSPSELPALFLPGYAGANPSGPRLESAQFYLRSVYLGVVGLALALGAPWRDRRTVLLALVGGVALVLALGRHGVLYPWLYELGFRQSRYPVKFLVLVAFALAAMAALGVDRTRQRLSREQGLVAGFLTLVPPGLLAAVVALRPRVSELASHQAGEALGALLRVGLLALLGLSVSRGWLRMKLAYVGLALTLGLDMASASRGLFLTVSPSDLLTPPASVQAVRRILAEAPGRFPRAYTGPVTQAKIEWVAAAGAGSPELVRRRLALLQGNANLYWRVPVERGGESMVMSRIAGVLDLVDRGPEAKAVLDLLGVRAMLLLGHAQGGLTPEVEAEPGVHRNLSALPRAFLVPEALPARDEEEELSRLTAPGFDPRREAVLAAGSTPVEGGPGRVELRRHEPHRLLLEVSSTAGGLLVVTDTWYPGWVALLDGQPAELLRVNHAFRGVRVGPGRHEIQMRYRPRSFRHGAVAALGGLLLLGVLLALPGRPRQFEGQDRGRRRG